MKCNLIFRSSVAPTDMPGLSNEMTVVSLVPSGRRRGEPMASSTLLAPGSGRPGFKTLLWISLGLTTLFVFITSEVLLVTDYPLYHAYRLQVIADRNLLIPHTLAGIF